MENLVIALGLVAATWLFGALGLRASLRRTDPSDVRSDAAVTLCPWQNVPTNRIAAKFQPVTGPINPTHPVGPHHWARWSSTDPLW